MRTRVDLTAFERTGTGARTAHAIFDAMARVGPTGPVRAAVAMFTFMEGIVHTTGRFCADAIRVHVVVGVEWADVVVRTQVVAVSVVLWIQGAHVDYAAFHPALAFADAADVIATTLTMVVPTVDVRSTGPMHTCVIQVGKAGSEPADSVRIRVVHGVKRARVHIAANTIAVNVVLTVKRTSVDCSTFTPARAWANFANAVCTAKTCVCAARCVRGARAMR